MTEVLDSDSGAVEPQDWGVARALLLEHPQLVHDDTQLLQALGLRPTAANVIEFGPAALARLEAARASEIAAREGVEALASANHDAQAEVHALVLDLLDAGSPTDLASILNEGARYRFGLEAAALGIEGLAPVGWRSLPNGLLTHALGPDGEYALGPCSGGREIFAEAAERVRSVALVRISLSDPMRCGVAAFGSSDPEHFSGDMGVELIAFIARVVERTAERWPQRG